jgi:hypothetical protein
VPKYTAYLVLIWLLVTCVTVGYAALRAFAD